MIMIKTIMIKPHFGWCFILDGAGQVSFMVGLLGD